MRDFFKQFHILYGEVLKWSKRRDSKSRRALTRRVGSNPTFSAKTAILAKRIAVFIILWYNKCVEL